MKPEQLQKFYNIAEPRSEEAIRKAEERKTKRKDKQLLLQDLYNLLIEKGFEVSSYDAPFTYRLVTHQLAMKWLRENNIIITPQPEYFSCGRCKSWGIDIWAFGNYEKLPGDFPTYEDAVEAALKYCLTELI